MKTLLSSRRFVVGMWYMLFGCFSFLAYEFTPMWCWVLIFIFYMVLMLSIDVLYSQSCSADKIKQYFNYGVTATVVWLVVRLTLMDG